VSGEQIGAVRHFRDGVQAIASIHRTNDQITQPLVAGLRPLT